MSEKISENEICKIFTAIVMKHPDYCADKEGEMPEDVRPIVLEFWQAAIQAGRDQALKELADMEPVACACGSRLANDQCQYRAVTFTPLIPQPTMPEK